MRMEQEVNVAKLLVEEGEHEVRLRGCGERIEVVIGDVTTRCKGLGIYSEQREKGRVSCDIGVWSDVVTTLTIEVEEDMVRFLRANGEMSERYTGLRLMTIPTAQKRGVEYESIASAVPNEVDDLDGDDELDLS